MALRDFAKSLNDDDLIARAEALILREETRVRKELEPWKARLKGKRVLLFTGGVKSWSVISALQDLGMVVVATGTKKSTEEDKARIRELMGEDTVMIDDGSPKALLKIVHDYKADILIAGGRNMYTALKAKVPFLDINQEREFGYEGYQGMLELVRQLALTIESPVWEAVRAPAPWKNLKPSPAVEGWVTTAGMQEVEQRKEQSPVGNQNKERCLYETPHPSLLPGGEGANTLKSTLLNVIEEVNNG
jgi:nitrogenase molybdenum-cofactor synthesis protein NifE